MRILCVSFLASKLFRFYWWIVIFTIDLFVARIFSMTIETEWKWYKSMWFCVFFLFQCVVCRSMVWIRKSFYQRTIKIMLKFCSNEFILFEVFLNIKLILSAMALFILILSLDFNRNWPIKNYLKLSKSSPITLVNAHLCINSCIKFKWIYRQTHVTILCMQNREKILSKS